KDLGQEFVKRHTQPFRVRSALRQHGHGTQPLKPCQGERAHHASVKAMYVLPRGVVDCRVMLIVVGIERHGQSPVYNESCPSEAAQKENTCGAVSTESSSRTPEICRGRMT